MAQSSKKPAADDPQTDAAESPGQAPEIVPTGAGTQEPRGPFTPSDGAPAVLDLRALLSGTTRLFLGHLLFYLLAGVVLIVGSSLTLGLLAGPLVLGLIRTVQAQTVSDTAPDMAQFLRASFEQLLPGVALGLIIGLAVFVGTLLVVLPGVVIAVVVAFSPFYLALENRGVINSLKASMALVKEHLGSTLLLLILTLAINLAGSLVVVGAVVTLPFSLVLMYSGFAALRGGEG